MSDKIKKTFKLISINKKVCKSFKLRKKNIFVNWKPMISNYFNLGSILLNSNNDNSKFIFRGNSGRFENKQWIFEQEDTIYQLDPINYYASEICSGFKFYWNGQDLKFENNQIGYIPEYIINLMSKKKFIEGIFYIDDLKMDLAEVIFNKSHHLKHKLKIKLLDLVNENSVNQVFEDRLIILHKFVEDCQLKWKTLDTDNTNIQFPIEKIPQTKITNMREAYDFYQNALKSGKKGIFLKNGLYENNKSSDHFLKWISDYYIS